MCFQYYIGIHALTYTHTQQQKAEYILIQCGKSLCERFFCAQRQADEFRFKWLLLLSCATLDPFMFFHFDYYPLF